MAIKQHLGKNTVHLQYIQDKILKLIFPQFQLTKQFMIIR